MSTIKSSNEHLTFNADGTSKEIRFQANGTQKASISSAGLFTSTTIDATKLTGTIPNFRSTGIDDNADATAITIDSSERIGIGTTSPEFPLEIGITSSTSQQVGFEITQATSSNDSKMRFKNSASSSYCRVGMDSSGTFFVEPFNGSAYVKHFNIKNDGKVGIGTTSPSGQLDIQAANGAGILKTTATTGTNACYGQFSNTGGGFIVGRDNSSGGILGGGAYASHLYSQGAYPLVFSTNAAERMRIRSDGKVNIGGTDTVGHLNVERKTAGAVLGVWNSHSDGVLLKFFSPAGAGRGSISLSGSTTTYATSSDYRLKENVDYTWDATTRLKQLKPARFNFIEDDTNTLVDGFIAHEVSSIVPEAITGKKDAVDDDGNIDPQGIDQSKLVPLLVKTIQELEARITAGGL